MVDENNSGRKASNIGMLRLQKARQVVISICLLIVRDSGLYLEPRTINFMRRLKPSNRGLGSGNSSRFSMALELYAL